MRMDVRVLTVLLTVDTGSTHLTVFQRIDPVVAENVAIGGRGI